MCADDLKICCPPLLLLYCYLPMVRSAMSTAQTRSFLMMTAQSVAQEIWLNEDREHAAWLHYFHTAVFSMSKVCCVWPGL